MGETFKPVRSVGAADRNLRDSQGFAIFFVKLDRNASTARASASL